MGACADRLAERKDLEQPRESEPVNSLLRLICFVEALADSRPHIATGEYCNSFARVFALHHRETAQACSRLQIVRLLQIQVSSNATTNGPQDDVADSLRSRFA